jgi:hypothetical protein
MVDGCKVCRVLDEHGLGHYDERILSEWRGDGTQRKGYRQLARWLNVTLLRREMDRAGLPTLGGEAESKYDRLQGEETNAVEVENILRREGIDVERLQADFVSYGVVRTHIIECLGAEYDPGTPDDWERDAIDIARDYARTKIHESVRSLARKGDLEAGEEITVDLDVALECETCGTRVRLRQALRQGEVCECPQQVVSND